MYKIKNIVGKEKVEKDEPILKVSKDREIMKRNIFNS